MTQETITNSRFRADVQERRERGKPVAWDVVFYEVGVSRTAIPALDFEDAYARRDALNFAVRDLD